MAENDCSVVPLGTIRKPLGDIKANVVRQSLASSAGHGGVEKPHTVAPLGGLGGPGGTASTSSLQADVRKLKLQLQDKDKQLTHLQQELFLSTSKVQELTSNTEKYRRQAMDNKKLLYSKETAARQKELALRRSEAVLQTIVSKEERKVKRSKMERKELEDHVEQLENDYEELVTQSAAEKTELVQAHDAEVQRIVTDSEQAKALLTQEHNEKVAQIEEAMNLANATLKQTIEDHQRLLAEFEKVVTERNEVKNKINDLETQVAALRGDLQRGSQENIYLKDQLDASTTHCERLTLANHALEASLTALKAAEEVTRREKAESQNLLSAETMHRESLQSQLSGLQSQHAQLANELAQVTIQKETALASLKAAEENSRREKAEAHNLLSSESMHRESLQSQHAQLVNELAQAIAQRDASLAALKTAEDVSRRQKVETQNLLSAETMHRESLQSQLSGLQSQHAQLANELTQVAALSQEQAASIARMQRQEQSLVSQLATASQDRSNDKETLHGLQSQLAKYRERCEASQLNIENLQRTLKESHSNHEAAILALQAKQRTDIAAEADKVAHLELAASQQQGVLRTLEERCETLRASIDRVCADRDEAQAKLVHNTSDFEREVAVLRRQLEDRSAALNLKTAQLEAEKAAAARERPGEREAQQKALQALREAYAANEGTMRAMEAQVAAYERSEKQLNAQSATLSAQLGEERKAKLRMEDALGAMTAHRNELQAHLTKVNATMEAEIKDLQQAHRELQRTAAIGQEDLRSNLNALKMQLESETELTRRLLTEKESLQAQLTNELSKANKMQSIVKSLQSENTVTNAETARLQDELAKVKALAGR